MTTPKNGPVKKPSVKTSPVAKKPSKPQQPVPKQPQRVSKTSELVNRIKALETENARLAREVKKLDAKVEKLQVDKALYKLRIRATEEENKRVRESKGFKKCYYEGSDSE